VAGQFRVLFETMVEHGFAFVGIIRDRRRAIGRSAPSVPSARSHSGVGTVRARAIPFGALHRFAVPFAHLDADRRPRATAAGP
jgi:hypothetical protein